MGRSRSSLRRERKNKQPACIFYRHSYIKISMYPVQYSKHYYYFYPWAHSSKMLSCSSPENNNINNINRNFETSKFCHICQNTFMTNAFVKNLRYYWLVLYLGFSWECSTESQVRIWHRYTELWRCLKFVNQSTLNKYLREKIQRQARGQSVMLFGTFQNQFPQLWFFLKWFGIDFVKKYIFVGLQIWEKIDIPGLYCLAPKKLGFSK